MPQERKKEIGGLVKFTGYVHDNSFRISKKTHYPQFFIPLIKGEIDSSSSGSVIRLTFKLFRNTRRWLMIWTLISFFSGCLFLLIHNTVIAGWSFLLCLLNYGVAVSNFRIHKKDSLKTIIDTLSLD